MMFVSAAVDRLSERLPWLLDKSKTMNVGLVLNSGFGELESTGDFLKAFSETGLARPLLFQNSLHNSTTGFLAIRLGLQGPVLTVNHREEGGRHAFETAETLIRAGTCEACLVVSVETVPAQFETESGFGLESASCIVLASDDFPGESLHEVAAHQPKFSASVTKFGETSGKTSLKSLQEFDYIHRLVSELELR
ncbi:MAG: beta-ketoacyl synthase chain length factor [Bdellovibrionota bacterium]